MSIHEQEQSLNPSPVVYLYELDFSTMKGGFGKAYWTPYRNGTSDITYGGQAYTYQGIELEGIEMESGGKLPAPRMKIFTKVEDTFFYKCLTEDVRGLRVTRIKTYAKYLDGAPDADATAHRKVVLYVNGLQMRAGTNLTFRMATNYGLEGVNNKANRTLNALTCINKYRIWNGTEFVYTPVKDGGCPWGNPAEEATWPASTPFGTPYLDSSDEETADPAQDRCSLSATGCMKRFSVNNPMNPIPYLADPKGNTKDNGGC